MKAIQIRNWERYFENAESRKIRKTTYVCVPNKHDGKGFARIAMHKQSCRVFTGWMLLLQVASKMPQRGLLVDEDGVLDVDDLAAMTRFDAATFKTAIQALSDAKVGWIEMVDIPDALETSGRNPEKIPIHQDGVPTRPDALGRTEQDRTEQDRTEGNGGEARTREETPPPKSNDPNPQIGQALDWINSIRSSWSETPHLTATEMHELMSTAGPICSLSSEAKQAVERYAATDSGRSDWALGTRQRFIANYPEVVQRAIEYAPPQAVAGLGMGGRKPRKVTDLRNTI